MPLTAAQIKANPKDAEHYIASVLKDLDEQAETISKLRAALKECAAPFRSDPCTVIQGATLLAVEFERRAKIAAVALSNS
jgi:hypothetical protein